MNIKLKYIKRVIEKTIDTKKLAFKILCYNYMYLKKASGFLL